MRPAGGTLFFAGVQEGIVEHGAEKTKVLQDAGHRVKLFGVYVCVLSQGGQYGVQGLGLVGVKLLFCHCTTSSKASCS